VAWPKGKPRPPGAGRKAGTLNRTTREWKEFVCSVAKDTQIQDKLRAACLDRPELLLKVAEHAVGKPKEQVEISGALRMIQWPDSEDVAE